MDLHQLRTFILIAEKKSFSAAAEAMLLSQPTLSSHIRRLEEDLGVVLFDRLPRRIELTRAGQILFRYGKDILRLHQNALNAIQEYCGRTSGILEVGGSTIPGEYILPGLLGHFHQAAPGVEIALRIADSRQITGLVHEGAVEVGMVGAEPEEGSLERIPLVRDTLAVIASPAFTGKKAGGVTLPWAEFLAQPHWIREPGSGTRLALTEALARRGMGLRDLILAGQLGSTEAVKRAVMAGGGLAVVSLIAVRDEVASGRLSCYQVPELDLDRSFWVIRHRHRSPSPAASLFHRFLLDEAPTLRAACEPASFRKRIRRRSAPAKRG